MLTTSDLNYSISNLPNSKYFLLLQPQTSSSFDLADESTSAALRLQARGYALALLL
jgi:hypothetical protein